MTRPLLKTTTMLVVVASLTSPAFAQSLGNQQAERELRGNGGLDLGEGLGQLGADELRKRLPQLKAACEDGTAPEGVNCDRISQMPSLGEARPGNGNQGNPDQADSGQDDVPAANAGEGEDRTLGNANQGNGNQGNGNQGNGNAAQAEASPEPQPEPAEQAAPEQADAPETAEAAPEAADSQVSDEEIQRLEGALGGNAEAEGSANVEAEGTTDVDTAADGSLNGAEDQPALSDPIPDAADRAASAEDAPAEAVPSADEAAEQPQETAEEAPVDTPAMADDAPEEVHSASRCAVWRTTFIHLLKLKDRDEAEKLS